jgi:hypothetical protein
VGWYGQGFAVSADKDAMARALLPPVDPHVSRHGPQLVDVPVQRIIPHGFEQFRYNTRRVIFRIGWDLTLTY